MSLASRRLAAKKIGLLTKNAYDVWMPTHLKRICSVIDQLPPDVDFEVSQGSELLEEQPQGYVITV
jgi:hypothetical protein